MLLVFKTLWSRAGAWLIVAGMVIAAVLKYGHDKKEEGEANLRNKINKETQDVKDKWSEIDRDNRTVDDALERLSRDD